MLEGFSESISKNVKKVVRAFKTPPCNVKLNIPTTSYKPFSTPFCLRAGWDVLFVFAG